MNIKIVLFYFVLLLGTYKAIGQKSIIDTSVYNSWPAIGRPSICNSGKFVFYSIRTQGGQDQRLIIQSTDLPERRIEIADASMPSFSDDSRFLVFVQREKQLGIVDLTDFRIRHLNNVASYVLRGTGINTWLACKTDTGAVLLENLADGERRTYENSKTILLSEDGKDMLLDIEQKRKGVLIDSLLWVDMPSNTVANFWVGAKINKIVADREFKRISFLCGASDGAQSNKSIWVYGKNEDKATELFASGDIGLDSGVEIGNIKKFSKDGSRLFIEVSDKQIQKAQKGAVMVDVWSYKDPKLQSQQLHELSPRSYVGVINIKRKKVIQLERGNEVIEGFERAVERNDSLALLVDENSGDYREMNWNPYSVKSYYLISLVTGTKRKMDRHFWISPNAKYLIYYDARQRNYFSYEVATGIIRDITSGISGDWHSSNREDMPGASNSTRGIAGWEKSDTFIYIYDRYDIWKVDPRAAIPPRNITNGYGRRHHIVFYTELFNAYSIIDNLENLVLSAFDTVNKNNGFYSLGSDESRDPKLLTMGPWIYDVADNPYVPDGVNFPPIKARDAGRFIIRRMSADSFPNLFVTSDFMKFDQLTSLYPEREYNWYTSTLYSWKSLDGRILQGILYKPEDFDPRKKYPLILNYYERASDGLNAYVPPEAASGNLNLVWYVSHGYLIFIPDIYYEIGYPGRSAYNCVMSAVGFLTKFSFVDKKHIGIQGFSFGGYETNYLVTHTHLFAAACSGSGASDLVSLYGGLRGSSNSNEGYYETGQGRMGCTLWNDSSKYIVNSPIFGLKYVTTPLLMMHTKKDGAVAFENAVELFTGLRRLGKKAWMLQYDDGNHGLSGISSEDFSIRMAQFFDHYLKGRPAPKWMTKGIPARLKGVDSGLEPDPGGIP